MERAGELIWIRRAAETGKANAVMMLVMFLNESKTEANNPFELYVWSTLGIRAGKFELKAFREGMLEKLSDEEWERARVRVEEKFDKFDKFHQ